MMYGYYRKKLLGNHLWEFKGHEIKEIKENLFKNQEHLDFMIMFLILLSTMFDSGVILLGEIRGC